MCKGDDVHKAIIYTLFMVDEAVGLFLFLFSISWLVVSIKKVRYNNLSLK